VEYVFDADQIKVIGPKNVADAKMRKKA